jgi:hypothetical protein
MNSGTFVWTVEGIATCLQIGAVLIVSLVLGLVFAAAAVVGWWERRKEEQNTERHAPSGAR